MEDTHTFKLH